MIHIKEKKLTEFKIQNILFNWCVRKKNHIVAIPNMYVHDWEADMISVTKAQYCHEYEIKISKADFKNDAKKPKHKLLMEQNSETVRAPSYFWYVCPEGMIDVSDVPEHAGLIVIGKWNRPIVKKKAPRISKSPITNKQLDKMLMGSQWRYWKMREKLDASEQQLESVLNHQNEQQSH